jgi:hypothetical protein
LENVIQNRKSKIKNPKMKSPFPVLMPMTHHLQHIIAAEASRSADLPSAICHLPSPRPATRAKYIILDLDGLEVAVILPEALQHSMALQDAHRRLAVSAGFFHIARQPDIKPTD